MGFAQRTALDTWPASDHNLAIMSRQTLSARHTRLLTALLLTLVLAACSPRQPTVVNLAPGATVEMEGWKLTVKSVRWLAADAYRKPSAGHGFLAVEITLENTTDGIRYIMPERQMLLLDPQGNELQPHPTAGVLAAREQGWLVVQGEIGPGQSVAGAVSYEAPLGLSGWRWVFRPRLLGSRVEAVLDLEGLTVQ